MDSPRSLAVAAALSLALTGLVAPDAVASPDKKVDNVCTTANVRLQGVSSTAPSNLCIPAGSWDDTSLLLVWNKPQGAARPVVDYQVLMDGDSLGSLPGERAAALAGPAVHRQRLQPRPGRLPREDGRPRLLGHRSPRELRPPVLGPRRLLRRDAVGTERHHHPAHGPPVPPVRGHRPAARSGGRRNHAQHAGDPEGDRRWQHASVQSRDPGRHVPHRSPLLHSSATLDLAPGARLLGSDRWQDYPLDKGHYLYPIPDPVPTEASYTGYLQPPVPHQRAAPGQRAQPCTGRDTPPTTRTTVTASSSAGRARTSGSPGATSGHGGIAIGSHTAAGVQDILAEDNVMYTTETGGLRVKSTSDMAGGARDITFRDTAMACLATNAFIASPAYSQSPSRYVPATSATFTDIHVSDVSVDANNTTTCGMPTTAKNPVILVQAGPTVNAAASTVTGFTLDRVRFRNVNPTLIEGLVSSTFSRVCFAGVLGDVNPWKLDAYSTGNSFVDVPPPPGTGSPTGSYPPKPAAGRQPTNCLSAATARYADADFAAAHLVTYRSSMSPDRVLTAAAAAVCGCCRVA